MPIESSKTDGLKPAERHEGRFQNEGARPAASLGKTLGIFWKMLFQKPSYTRPHAPIPVSLLTREARNNPEKAKPGTKATERAEAKAKKAGEAAE